MIFIRRRRRKESYRVPILAKDTALPLITSKRLDPLENPLYLSKTDNNQNCLNCNLSFSDNGNSYAQVRTKDTKHLYEMDESGAYAQPYEHNYTQPEAAQYVSTMQYLCVML